jgi:murein DD-endopeptidase MepM/ murein hydrolase activator NlpD
MKHRLIITISDHKGTKSYNLSKLVRHFIIWIVVFFVLIASIGAIVIPYLATKVVSLTSQNEAYQQELEDKIAAYDKLDHQFDALEERIISYEKSTAPPPGINIAIDKLNPLKPLSAKEKLARMEQESKFVSYILQHIPSGKPVEDAKITSGFGYRIHPVFRTKKLHHGIDFGVHTGTPVKSTADGIVTRAVSTDSGGYGKLVVIRHMYGFSTAYAHLSSSKVRVGDVVKKGQVIARSGNSGRSTGPHLHFEVQYNGNAINPIKFISWNKVNYTKIFKMQKEVPWDSLLKKIRK